MSGAQHPAIIRCWTTTRVILQDFFLCT